MLVAQWLTRFCILLAVVKMLGLEADFHKMLLLQWMVFVAILVTPTPGGTGVPRQVFCRYLLAVYLTERLEL